MATTPMTRYRQIKAIEGVENASAWARSHIKKLLYSGLTAAEIAQQFGWSVRWAERMIAETKAELRTQYADNFSAKDLIAEHMMTYQAIQQQAFLTLYKTSNVSDVDKHRAAERLLLTMRQQVDFISNLGGLKGVTMSGATDDDAVVAARQMGDRLRSITDQMEAIMAETDDMDGEDEVDVEELEA